MNTNKQYIYIGIAGMIGVGKSTLTAGLANALNAKPVYEEYDQNPFLARQIKGDHSVALPSELYFLLSRARQLSPDNLFDHKRFNIAISDYIVEKNRLFASMFLNDHEFSIFEEIERSILPHIAKPDLVIYLHDTPENCLTRIMSRGRDFETSITLDWLHQLSNAYDQMIDSLSDINTIKIDCADKDFRNSDQIQYLLNELNNIFPNACLMQ